LPSFSIFPQRLKLLSILPERGLGNNLPLHSTYPFGKVTTPRLHISSDFAMTRSSLPPTPASSSDIRGKEDPRLSTEKISFALPPPAIASAGSHCTSTNSQPSHQITSSDFSLPPPPTRSRKIIQMKPKSQQNEESSNTSAQHTTKGSNKRGASGSAATSTLANKKQPSATSVAGKKIARKTAHSVIERRRRSKMNEEFSVLKDMIPACKDQEMHKLAILQVRLSLVNSKTKAVQSNLVLRQALITSATLNSASPTSKLQIIPCLIQLSNLKPHRFASTILRRIKKERMATTMTTTIWRWRTWILPAILRLSLPCNVV